MAMALRVVVISEYVKGELFLGNSHADYHELFGTAVFRLKG